MIAINLVGTIFEAGELLRLVPEPRLTSVAGWISRLCCRNDAASVIKIT